jgi:hypothetical protein
MLIKLAEYPCTHLHLLPSLEVEPEPTEEATEECQVAMEEVAGEDSEYVEPEAWFLDGYLEEVEPEE